MPESAKDILASAQRSRQVSFEDLGRAGLTGESGKLLAAVQANAKALNGMLDVLLTKAGIVALSLQADKMLASADLLNTSLESAARQQSA